MDKNISDISLVLVTKYSSGTLALCIDTLLKNSALSNELIIIADNPSAQVLKVLNDRHMDYCLVQTGHFFRNCNIGAEKATRNYVGFVNDDVIFGPQWDVPLQKFIDTYKKPALISSNLVTPNRNFYFGYDPSKGVSTFNLSEFEEYAKKSLTKEDIQSFFWMPLLIPRHIFNKYGGFTTFSSHGHGHENVLENIIIKKENLKVRTIMSSTLFHFGSVGNTDNMDQKYIHISPGYFKCSLCGKEEEGIFNDADSGFEIDKLRNGDRWICYSCRK